MNRPFFLGILTHALAAAVLLVIPSLWLGKALWLANPWAVLIALVFAFCYFVSAVVLLWREATETRPGLWRVINGGIVAFGAAFILLVFAEWQLPGKFGAVPPLVPLTSAALGMLILLGLFGIRGAVGAKIVVLTVVVMTGVVAHFALSRNVFISPTREIGYLDSSLYSLKTTTYRNWIFDGTSRGGGIAVYGEGYVVGDGDGGLYFVREDNAGDSLQVRKLAYRVPFNPVEFEEGAQRILGDKWRGRAGDFGFKLRVADLQLRSKPDGSFQLYVSHHYWNTQEGCAVVRISVLEGGPGNLLADAAGLEWRTLFETAPCLTLNAGGRGIVFGALQIGGAMGFLGENELLVAIGDHEFDGWNRSPELPQDPASPYGKVLLIRLDTGQAEVFSLGHRNPQGLFVDSQGAIWSTEHGPRGGDELNRVVRGANYGWPRVTYGTEYSVHHWPLNSTPGRHDGFEKPTMTFIPSLGLTGLTSVTGEKFGAWRGDLLLVSLDGELRRIRIEDERAVLAEPFTIGTRIRDVVEGPDGRLVLWTDHNDLVFLEPAEATSAEALVFQCTGCHTLNPWEGSSIGPNLRSVVGRRVGGEFDFDYSPAMKNFGGKWSRERLDQFLQNPAGAVPGTTMIFAGIADASQREQLIDYLERNTKK